MTKILQWIVAYAMVVLYRAGLHGIATRLYRLSGLPLFQGAADSTNAQIGATIDLAYWDTVASPDAWADIGQIRSISGVGVTKPEVDSTTLDSTAMEYIGGLENGDTFTMVITTGATNTNIDRTLLWLSAATEIEFKLTVNSPATETLYFSVTPLHYDLGTIQPNNLVELTFSGRITGGITATPSHP